MTARQEDAALRVLAFVTDTTIALRHFSSRPDIELVWPPNEPEPVPLAAGGKLVVAINDLPVTHARTMQQEYPTYKPRELFEEYLGTYQREREASEHAEKDLQELASELKSQVGETSAGVVKAHTEITAAKAKLLDIQIPNLSKVDDAINSALSRLATARDELKVGIVVTRAMKSTVTWVFAWIPWTLGRIAWIVLPWQRLGLSVPWMGTTWKDKSARYWVSAMNQLIATSEPYFNTDSLKDTAGVADQLLPVYRASVLTSAEKIAALRVVAELTIMLTARSEAPKKGDPTPGKKNVTDKILRRASTMMRVLHASLREYAKLGVQAAEDIAPLMNGIAAHSLTILYFFTFEKVANAELLDDFNDYDAIDMEWFDSVYFNMDWFESAEELDSVEYSPLIEVARVARDETAWSAAIEDDAPAALATAPPPSAPTIKAPPPILKSRDAYMLAPREPDFKRLEVANNLRGGKVGIGAVIQATILSHAITEGDFLVETIHAAYTNFVSATETIGLTLQDSGQARQPRKLRKLRDEVRSAVIDADGELKLEELHPSGEDATDVELVQLLGELRMRGMGASQYTLGRRYTLGRQYTLFQAKLDVASANVVDALASVQAARQTLGKISASSDGEEYKDELGDISDTLRDSAGTIERVIAELDLGQGNADKFDDVMSVQIDATSRVTGRERRKRKVRVAEAVTPEAIETEWLEALHNLATAKTRRNVDALSETALWDNKDFGIVAPLTIIGSPAAMQALETLQHIAERRAADMSVELTEDPAKVAQMLDSIVRAMHVFSTLPKTESFGVKKTVGGAIHSAITSALGIEYQAAWEYANQQEIATQPQHLYNTTQRQQLLLSQNWFSVPTLNANYLQEFRQAARNAYP